MWLVPIALCVTIFVLWIMWIIFGHFLTCFFAIAMIWAWKKAWNNSWVPNETITVSLQRFSMKLNLKTFFSVDEGSTLGSVFPRCLLPVKFTNMKATSMDNGRGSRWPVALVGKPWEWYPVRTQSQREDAEDMRCRSCRIQSCASCTSLDGQSTSKHCISRDI